MSTHTYMLSRGQLYKRALSKVQKMTEHTFHDFRCSSWGLANKCLKKCHPESRWQGTLASSGVSCSCKSNQGGLWRQVSKPVKFFDLKERDRRTRTSLNGKKCIGLTLEAFHQLEQWQPPLKSTWAPGWVVHRVVYLAWTSSIQNYKM